LFKCFADATTLTISTDGDEPQIPLVEQIQKKCKMDPNGSNLPTKCLINGEEYAIQAIIVWGTTKWKKKNKNQKNQKS